MLRNISFKINQLLEYFPAVVILGARQSGKTTLAKALRPDWLYCDLERASDFNRIEHDPEFFFQQYPQHIIIDEAQRSPKLFETLRGVIDHQRNIPGRFILSGSSSPELLKNVTESLAGRVAIVELGTFKANEIFGKPLSPIYNLLAENKFTRENLSQLGSALLDLKEIQLAWQKGGYPEPVLSTSENFYWQWMENYENTYIARDIANLFPRLNRVAYQRFLPMLCNLSSTILNKSDIARALEVSASSVQEFLAIAEGTFLWRALPSYENSVSKSLVKMPKGHIRDSGLLHSLLNITQIEQLYKHPVIGASFEAFVIEEIIKGLQATLLTHWSTYYYRTRGGAEIDLILQGPFGTIPIEIKYGSTATPRQLKSLENFVKENNLDFALLINQADKAIWLSKTVCQLPANYL
ncbi:MAG: ATPase protein [Gammaproteobacteria bacterium]|jgi:predicted AAA+ superfamily ATPase|nr:ATPase protein [Gammaproteobacteria bacterium]